MKVGFITIGQSPRVDVVPEIKPYLGDVEIIECGALDALTLEEIEELAPKEGDYVLVSRLRDGTQARLSRERIVKRLQECVKKLEKEVDVIGVLCTGEFPKIESKKLLVEPSLLLLKTVEALGVSNLGVIVPDPDQIEMTKRKWSDIAGTIKVQSVSPYIGKEEDLIKAAQELKDCNLIIMDCFGYNKHMKKTVYNIVKKPVILPRTLLAHLLRALVD